jgi:hypothetical protein
LNVQQLLPSAPDHAPHDFSRRFARFKVAAPVVIERGDAPPCLGLTSDAAIGGCCLMVDQAIGWYEGDMLKLSFDGDQSVDCVIRWARGTRIAVEFATPFETLILDHCADSVRITADHLQLANPSLKSPAGTPAVPFAQRSHS